MELLGFLMMLAAVFIWLSYRINECERRLDIIRGWQLSHDEDE